MRLRLACALLFLSACAFAQNTPQATMFGGGWNSVSPGGSPTTPNPWCPQDSSGATATIKNFRLWDDGMKWSQVETTAASPTDTTGYTFTKMDWALGANVAGHAGCNVKTLYQLGATPAFAAAAGSATTCAQPDPTNACRAPSDVNGDGTGADAWWLNFIGQVALRYSGRTGTKGQMSYYGIWNEADSPNFWCWNGTACGGGTNPANNPNVASLNNLVLMAWDMMKITRCMDSTSRIVSPDGHVGSMPTWFSNYVNTTIVAPARNITITPPAGSTYAPVTCSWGSQTVHGYQTFDIVDEHMRGTNSTNSDPTSVIAGYNAAALEMNVTDPVLSTYPLWNDEWGWNGNTSSTCQIPNVATGAAYVGVQIALMSSFTGPSIQQQYFYFWDHACQAPPSQTIIGLAWDVVGGWVIGGSVNPFTKAGTVYSIPLTLSTSGSAKIMFDSSKTCSGAIISTCATGNQSAGSFTSYTDISGTPHAVSDGFVPVGLAPILLTGGSAPTAATPTFSPTPTLFSGSSTPLAVNLSTTSPGAIICYTTNGTTPATNGATGCTTGTKYTGAVSISVNTSFNAVAGGTGYTDSTVATGAYSFAAGNPTLNPNPGTYPGPKTITITDAVDPGVSNFCYTTNGTNPTSDGNGNCTNGTLYTAPFSLTISAPGPGGFKAMGIKSGWTDGNILSYIYILTYNLTSNIVGSGAVVSSPSNINCPGVCTGAFSQGTSPTLTATPGSGYIFSGWSGGGCAGTGTCAPTLNADTTVTATFTQGAQVSTGVFQGVMLQ